MKKKHFFVGSGDYGYEILKWNSYYKEINFSGFIDKFKSDEVIQGIEKFKNRKERSDFTITIGNPEHRSHVYENLKNNKNLNNTSIIFSNVEISKNSKIGKGSILMNNVTVANDVRIGKNCHIHGNAIIGHNVVLGNNVNIGAGVFIGGHSIIGDNTAINANSTVISKIKIGKNVIVGTGSVVLKNLDDNISVFGSPARKIFSK